MTTPIGLIGLDPLAIHLTRAGFTVASSPDLRIAADRVHDLVTQYGNIGCLILNQPRVQSLIPRIYRHVNLTVLGTEQHPIVGDSDGYRTYQLRPGSTVVDVLKNAGVVTDAVDLDQLPPGLQFEPDGSLLDPNVADWSEWDPDRQAPRRAAASVATPARLDPDEEFFAESVRRALRGGAIRTGQAEVLFTLSGSGGVGKSSLALSVANRAANRGRRVVLIDANLGQPDLATFLRVADGDLPTVFDAVIDDNVRTGIISPVQLNRTRDARLSKVNFAFIQGPTAEQLATGRITTGVLAGLISQVRQFSDLVVLDTQILERDDPRGLVSEIIEPELGAGGWALAVTGMSTAGLSNLIEVMERLLRLGVNPSHVMSLINRVPTDIPLHNQDRIVAALRELSVHLGTVWEDNEILSRMNAGELVSDLPVCAHLIDTVLQRIFDMPIEAPPYQPGADRDRRRWFRRRGKDAGR